MGQQLAPGTLDRQRLDLTAVGREAAVLDQAAVGEQGDSAPVRGPIERDREVEVTRVHADRRAGDRDPLGIAGELKLRRRGPQLLELEVAIAEDGDLTALDPPVHAAGHLQDLVGTQVQPVEHIAAALDHVAVAGVVDHHRVQPTDVEGGLARGRHREQERALDLAFEKGTDHADRLTAMIERRREPPPLLAQIGGEPLDLRSRRDEHRHAPLLLHQVTDIAIVEEFVRGLRQHLDLRLELRIEGVGDDHILAAEVSGVEQRIHRRAQPDVPDAGALAQRQAELELGGGLVDLVHDDGVARGDQVVLEPAPRDAGGHDDHVPARRVRGGLALAVDDADLERLAQDRFGHGPDGERLARPGPGNDPEGLPGPGQLADLLPVLTLEHRLQVEAQGQLDRFAGGPGRGDDDDASGRMGGVPVGVGIGRKVVVARWPHYERKGWARPSASGTPATSKSRLEIELPDPALFRPIEPLHQVHLRDGEAEQAEMNIPTGVGDILTGTSLDRGDPAPEGA